MRSTQLVWFSVMVHLIARSRFDCLFVECDVVPTYIFCLSLPSPVKMANRHLGLLIREQGHSLTTHADYAQCINRAINEGFRILYPPEVGEFTHTVKYIGKNHKLAHRMSSSFVALQFLSWMVLPSDIKTFQSPRI